MDVKRTYNSFLEIFPSLNDKDKKILDKFIEVKFFPEGIPLTAEGNPADGIYIIKSGGVDVTVEKERKKIAKLQKGELFGEISFIFDLPQTATLYTAENTELMYIKKENYELLKKKYPDTALKMTIDLAKMLYTRLIKQ